MRKLDQFPDGTEIFRARTAAEQVAEQNRRAAESYLRTGNNRRIRDRGCNEHGIQRRKTDRRSA